MQQNKARCVYTCMYKRMHLAHQDCQLCIFLAIASGTSLQSKK